MMQTVNWISREKITGGCGTANCCAFINHGIRIIDNLGFESHYLMYISNRILYEYCLGLGVNLEATFHVDGVTKYAALNTLRPRQNGCHFPGMFKCVFLNEDFWIQFQISLKFVPKVSTNNNPALFQIMAWHRTGDKPLSEPIMVSSLMHICVTRPQWVNSKCQFILNYSSIHVFWCIGFE